MSSRLLTDAELPSGKVDKLVERISFVVFWGIHVATLAAFWTGVPARALWVALALYWLRMFAITGGYHRYFAHRSYRTSRPFQFLLALLGTSTIQKGPLWWASTHRRHHKYSDTPQDVHSPKQHGFWYSHVGWISSGDHIETDMRIIKDFASYPELVWLGRFHFVAPLALAVLCYYVGGGWAGLVVGFGWSTVVLWHSTFTINSLSHVFGSRRYETTDTSRNNWLLALLTMGEGWHNNHHHYMNSVNQGFFWWEVDVTYYILRGLEKVGLVWDLKVPPKHVLVRHLVTDGKRSGAKIIAAVGSGEELVAAESMAEAA